MGNKQWFERNCPVLGVIRKKLFYRGKYVAYPGDGGMLAFISFENPGTFFETCS